MSNSTSMDHDIAVLCSGKLYRIRQLVEREPTTSLAGRILAILNEIGERPVHGQPDDGYSEGWPASEYFQPDPSPYTLASMPPSFRDAHGKTHYY